MPRDGNGNYTLPAGNPVVTGTPISSGGWANPTLSDLANEMQDSLSRSGKGGFTAPVGIVDGSAAVPGLNFLAEPTTGWRREGTEDSRFQVTGTDSVQVTKNGVKVRNGGVLKDVAVEESGVVIMRVPSGTRFWLYADTPPPNWTFHQPDGNVRQIVLGPQGAGGTIGGTIDPNNLTQALSVSITGSTDARNLDHVHSGNSLTMSLPSITANRQAGSFGVADNQHIHAISGNTGAMSANQSHLHGSGTLSGSSNVSITPRYARGILASPD